jgi:hypothetical protein
MTEADVGEIGLRRGRASMAIVRNALKEESLEVKGLSNGHTHQNLHL